LPDCKYGDKTVAAQYSNRVKDYPEIAKTGLREMHRQVGVLQTNNQGIAVKGLMIRHLVLPNGLAGSKDLIRFVAEELDTNTYVNIMPQYRPCYQAHQYPGLNRRITTAEFQQVLDLCQKHGLTNLAR